MNELLQKHGCSNVFAVPEGLKELMSDITREVLRIQPKRIHDFIANYLAALLITREHGIMAVKILEDLCDCRPSVSEHLLQVGFEREEAETLAEIIKTEIEQSTIPVEGKEKLKEYLLLKKILEKVKMDEEMTAEVCQVARNAYKDYWYRRNLLKQGLKAQEEEEPWEIAARNTLNLYKSTKPSISELNRASEKIQAAYRGYHIRRNVLRHLLPKKDKMQGRKVDLSGPPLDIAASREADLGPLITIRTTIQDNVEEMFDNERIAELGLAYDPHKTITHVESDENFLKGQQPPPKVGRVKMADSVGKDKRDKSAAFADETPDMDHSAIVAADSQKAVKSTKTIVSQSSPSKSLIGQSTIHRGGTQSAFDPSTNRISFSVVPPEVIEDNVEPDSTMDKTLEVPKKKPGETTPDSTCLSGLDTSDATDEGKK